VGKKTDLTVKYQNKLNMIALKDFNAKEMDLFFALCAKMKDSGVKPIVFSFEELRELSNYKITATSHFIKDLDSLYTKMLQLTYQEGLFDDDDEGFRRFVLFTEFEVSTKRQTVKVIVNSKLESVLNNLTTEFNKFELVAFTEINSKYTKTLFRLLMQFKSTGLYIVDLEEFRTLLDIPKSYRIDNIDQRILKPALDELQAYFKNLKLEKIKAKKGNKIEKLKFTFDGLQSDLPKIPMHNYLEH